jgi:hypothetical protein
MKLTRLTRLNENKDQQQRSSLAAQELMVIQASSYQYIAMKAKLDRCPLVFLVGLPPDQPLLSQFLPALPQYLHPH